MIWRTANFITVRAILLLCMSHPASRGCKLGLIDTLADGLTRISPVGRSMHSGRSRAGDVQDYIVHQDTSADQVLRDFFGGPQWMGLHMDVGKYVLGDLQYLGEYDHIQTTIWQYPESWGGEQKDKKTDKTKSGLFSFGGKVLMHEKSPPLFWGQFSFRPIILFVFVFSFSLFQWIWSENAVEGSWGVNLVNSLPKVHSKVR